MSSVAVAGPRPGAGSVAPRNGMMVLRVAPVSWRWALPGTGERPVKKISLWVQGTPATSTTHDGEAHCDRRAERAAHPHRQVIAVHWTVHPVTVRRTCPREVAGSGRRPG